MLLLLDPSIAYAAGIAMAAALSAIFTSPFLLPAQAGLTRVGAVAAGGTFACAGYFASRVIAGHLPLLEAYPALPLLLWLVDRALTPERAPRRRFDLGVLAVCCTCVVVAGHPQLPAYSLASALLYALWKGGRKVPMASALGAMMLGAGLALVVWWLQLLLLIARSTRVLRLAAADNDIAMPYSRLPALLMPGIHGWPQPVELADHHPFTGYPNAAYFWDTASYIGILPLVAVAALLIGCIVRKRMPNSRWTFLAFLGVVAFLCSLPPASPLLHLLPGTLLRGSPARLLYLSTFCAAVATGVAVDALRRARWPFSTQPPWFVVAVVLCLHFADLFGFAHWFIQTIPREDEAPAFRTIVDREVGDGRIAQERAYYATVPDDDHRDVCGRFRFDIPRPMLSRGPRVGGGYARSEPAVD